MTPSTNLERSLTKWTAWVSSAVSGRNLIHVWFSQCSIACRIILLSASDIAKRCDVNTLAAYLAMFTKLILTYQ